jgi:hypothetical protein
VSTQPRNKKLGDDEVCIVEGLDGSNDDSFEDNEAEADEEEGDE